jgi:F-type H+-transporting ATPase subunit gamma
MASAREIRRRIKSVKNIAQVTRALQAVSASKVRRAQEAVLATRAYAELAWEVLSDLSRQVGANEKLHPLFELRPVKTAGVVMLSGDRGLCGAFNYNVVRTTVDFCRRYAAQTPVRLITVGKKGRELMWRRRFNIVHEFSGLPAAPRLADVTPIARAAMDGFRSGEFDVVYLSFTDFVNTMVQKPVVKRLLPLRPTELESQAMAEYVEGARMGRMAATDYIYEPSPEAILDVIVPRFTELQVFQAVLESLASEHSARMVAMQNATENAGQLAGELTLRYNKARQQSITSELLDIAGGAEALAQARAAG